MIKTCAICEHTIITEDEDFELCDTCISKPHGPCEHHYIGERCSQPTHFQISYMFKGKPITLWMCGLHLPNLDTTTYTLIK